MTAALLTPPGAAAIAVVRIHGDGVGAFLASHFSAAARLDRAVHGELSDGSHLIDDPVVVLVDAQTADLNLHGGPWVLRATLDLLARYGFAVDSPAPTSSARTDMLDAEDLLWQEVLAALPRAKTELAVRMLLAQSAAWKGLLRSSPTQNDIKGMLADRTMGRMLQTPTVAIVGPANVGKSTLANRFFGQQRSITADIPGTTRDWVGELANLHGVAVMLVDTPGIRASSDAIEQTAIARAKDRISSADVVVAVLDGARAFDAEQADVLRQNPGALVAINKSDAPAAWNVAHTVGSHAIAIAAKMEAGIDTLRRRILSHLGCDDLRIDSPRCWTVRQRAILRSLADA